MKTENKKNNKLNEKNNLSVQATGSVQETAKRKRGRPKGSKNKEIRQDRIELTAPGENAKFIKYSLALTALPKIDVNNIEQVKARITEYFSITNQFDLRVSVAALALSFGISRITLFNWLNGKTETIKNRECLNTIKQAHDIICNQYEYLMNSGKINPVSGIFLMKNNFGYKDNTELNIIANQDKQETISDITNRANLLD